MVTWQVQGYFQQHQQSFYVERGQFLADDDETERVRKQLEAPCTRPHTTPC